MRERSKSIRDIEFDIMIALDDGEAIWMTSRKNEWESEMAFVVRIAATAIEKSCCRVSRKIYCLRLIRSPSFVRVSEMTAFTRVLQEPVPFPGIGFGQKIFFPL